MRALLGIGVLVAATSPVSSGQRAGRVAWADQTVFDLPLQQIRLPALLVGHAADACLRSPPSQLDRIGARIGSARRQVVPARPASRIAKAARRTVTSNRRARWSKASPASSGAVRIDCSVEAGAHGCSRAPVLSIRMVRPAGRE
jgi:hypothetical protein